MALTTFLLCAAQGRVSGLSAELDADPTLIDAAGAHPYWGGQVTALHLAAEWGRADCVEHLLARGASPNPPSAAYDRWTPLQIAIHKNHSGIVETLLGAGAELTVWAAAALGRLADLERAAASGAGPGPNDATALHFAATVTVAQWLLDRGARLDALDKYGRTPAAALAQYGSRFREAGLYLTTLAGDMDLVRAAAFGELEEVRRLYDPAIEVLPTAALHGHLAIVRFLLLEKGASPNAGFPLHQAARNGHLEVAKFLLARGADAALPDPWHQATPLDWAGFHDQPALAELLRRPLY